MELTIGRQEAEATAQREPLNGLTADEVLALMTEVMRTAWGNPSSQHPQGAAARAMGKGHPNRLRYAAPTGTVVIRWDGSHQPDVWNVPAPEMDPHEARQELARRPRLPLFRCLHSLEKLSCSSAPSCPPQGCGGTRRDLI